MTDTADSVPDLSERLPREPAPAATPGRRGRGALEWVVIVLAALAAAFLIKTFLVQAYVIPTGSMEPTIEPGDRVLVDKLSYDLHAVHRGDIIVFAKPATDTESVDIKDLIKRVIGLPGETLRSGPHGEVFVDGRLIRQPWLTTTAKDNPGPPICDPGLTPESRLDCVGDVLHLPKDDYYMMGDNRGDSEDSRYWGPLSGKLIVGRAFVRIWPLSRLHWF